MQLCTRAAGKGRERKYPCVVFCMHMWITLWITCGYVDNFLPVYVFVLYVYGFLWVESDKFYMFECVVDNFVDNLWITPDTKTKQKINRYNYIDKTVSNRQKEKEKTPGKCSGAYVVSSMLSWLSLLWWLH